MGQYLEWSIAMTMEFKFVQMKSLGSQMATPSGDIILKKVYRANIFKNLLPMNQ